MPFQKGVIMFELFVMSLREYWNEVDDSGMDVNESIKELQGVLTEHYGKSIVWDEPEIDDSKKDEEISVDVIDDRQISAVHAVAAKLELDGNLDGFEFDPDEPWECDIFDRLADELDDEETDRDVEKFCHLLSIGNSSECIAIPVDLPSVAQININGDEDESDEEHEHHCDCGDDECDCFEEDDGSIDIASLPALRRELDEIAKALKLNASLSIDDIDDATFDDVDPYRHAKIGWYIMSAKIDEALKAKLPLIIRFADDDEYDDIEDEDDQD